MEDRTLLSPIHFVNNMQLIYPSSYADNLEQIKETPSQVKY